MSAVLKYNSKMDSEIFLGFFFNVLKKEMFEFLSYRLH